MTRCVALLSGGLDSMLAIRLMQDQGIEVEALNFQTVFTCCRDTAAAAAHDLGVRLTVSSQRDDYLDVIKKPKFGYGKGANPCIDCRIYMFAQARQFMHQTGASFVVSGEVLGQRPKSQKRRDLDIIAYHSGLEGLLLRPLSARLLPATRPEQQGLVDREQLFGFVGRSRKGLIELARRFRFREIPSPSTGCALTEKLFSRKVFDLVQFDADTQRWDFELLRLGRHYRVNYSTKLVVGRNEQDNQHLQYLFQQAPSKPVSLLEPENFIGPALMIVGSIDDPTLRLAGGVLLRHSRRYESDNAQATLTQDGKRSQIRLRACDASKELANVAASTSHAHVLRSPEMT